MNIENYPAPEPKNMENFGGLQYIIDKLPRDEQFILTQYFVHGLSRAHIARKAGRSIKVINRILRNLRRINLTNPVLNFRGKKFNGHS